MTSNKPAASGLFAMFSDESKAKFSRVNISKSEPPVIPKIVEEDISDKKKKKRKRAQPETDASVAESTQDQKQNAGEIETAETVTPEMEKNGKTLFLGNIAISVPLKTITKMCAEFGEIESSRMRSVPIAGTAVDEDGNQKLVKRVCTNAKKFGEQKGSYNVYIVYKEAESVAKAVAKLNNTLIENRHIRADTIPQSLFDTKRTLFIGGIPYYADEEQLRQYFAAALPHGQDDIEGVRLIRDPETLIGKGIGYVLLKDRDSVMSALSLHESMYKKKYKIRVQTCGKRTKRQQKKLK